MKCKYTCTCCWFYTFNSVFSTSEICCVCWLQDDITSTLYVDISFSISGKTFFQLQEWILHSIPLHLNEFKKWKEIYKRNPLWKPLDKNKFDIKHKYFPKWKFEEYKNKYPKHYKNKEKSMIEGQKYNPDEKVHIEL